MQLQFKLFQKRLDVVSVRKVAGYGPDIGSILGREETSHHYIQTRSVVHPVSYTMRIGVCFPGGKSRCESNNSRPSSGEIWNPCVLLRHRGNCLIPEEALLSKRSLPIWLGTCNARSMAQMFRFPYKRTRPTLPRRAAVNSKCLTLGQNVSHMR
jgi:hypothetical protein